MQTILVALDFSPASMEALNYAIPLAKAFEAGIHLVHIQEPDEPSSVPEAGHLMREAAGSLKLACNQLSQIQEERVPSFWPKNCHVRIGTPYQEICDLAREIGAHLIVLATRGHTGLKHVLLGSTAERVVRTAPCPVLIVRSTKKQPPVNTVGEKADSSNIRKILVAVDFSPCSLAGAMQAADLARTLAAKLCLFHAVRPPLPIVVDRVSANMAQINEAAEASARASMDRFAQLEFLHDIPVETEIGTGYAVDEICSQSDKSNIDLVVMATHGQSGLKRMLLGSVAEHVVRYAQCPVLVVPSRPSA